MKQAEPSFAFDAWLDESPEARDLSRVLTGGLGDAGAVALVMMRWGPDDAPGDLVGASAGAPVALVQLCRDLGAAAPAHAPQERRISGIGAIAWVHLPQVQERLVLFGLYSEAADIGALLHLSGLCARCGACAPRH